MDASGGWFHVGAHGGRLFEPVQGGTTKTEPSHIRSSRRKGAVDVFANDGFPPELAVTGLLLPSSAEKA